MVQLSDYQRDVLTRTLLGEARGEGEQGMEAVAHVINNRWQSGQFAGDPASVALQPYQFSTWNKGEGGNNPQQFSKSSRQYQNAASIVDRVFGGQSQDPTNGALYYHTPQVSPAWAGDVNKFGTIKLGNHIFYNGRPTPPGEIPNVVATQTDTQRPQRIMGQSNAPTSAASRRFPTMGVTPRLAPGNGDIYSYRIPDQTPTSVVGGLGSLTPDRASPPLPRPRPVTPRDIANVPYSQGVNIPLMAPTPRQLPALPPSSLASSNSVNAAANVDPGLRAALERQAEQRAVASVPYSQGQRVPISPSGVGQPPATRSVASVPVPVPRITGMTTDRGAMPTRAGFLADFGLSNSGERLAAPMPATAIPGPNAMPKGETQLTAGLFPMAPVAVPDALPAVGTALDVAPNVPGFPPLPRPRPVPFSMPTPMGQRPTLPMPRAVTGFPTAFGQRPVPQPTMRVTVNGAGSYNAPSRAPTPTREQQIAAILARSRGPAAFGGGGTIDGAVQPIGTLTGRR